MRGENRSATLPRACLLALALSAALCAGCREESSDAEIPGLIAIWGGPGRIDGRFVKPRVIEALAGGTLCVIDRSGRVQFLGKAGEFIGKFVLGDVARGFPVGMTATPDGNIWIAETHAYRVAVYSPDGRELFAFGGMGTGDGQFVYVTDVAVTPSGQVFASDFGTVDRVQEFDISGNHLRTFGGTGTAPGRFQRPQALAVTADGSLLIADACNHRIQKFAPSGEIAAVYGEAGTGEGQLRYPYDLAVAPSGMIYIAEYGNCRIQRMAPDGQFLGTWGRRGSGPGELAEPWGVTVDAEGRLFIMDTGNSRVVVVDPEAAEWSSSQGKG